MTDSISLGTAIYSAVRPMFKLYFIIFTGYTLAKRNWLSVETARNLSNMVLICFVPCLIMDKVITYISNSDIKQIGIIVLSAFIMYTTGFFYAFIMSFFLPVPKRWKGGFIVGATLPNVSDLPIAYLQSMAGGVIFTDVQSEKGVAYIIIYLATYIIVQFSCGLFRLVEYDFREMKNDDSEKQNEHKLESESENDEDTETDQERAHKAAEQTSQNTRRRTIVTSGTTSTPPLVDDAGVALSPTSTLSSDEGASLDQNIINPIAFQDGSARHDVHSARVNRRASMETHSSRSSYFSSNDLVREYSRLEPFNTGLTNTVSIVTENVSSKVVHESGANIKFVTKYRLNWLIFMLKNFLKPASLALIFSLTVSMIPWVKALFVTTTVSMPSAPDEQPPLAFFMDYVSYIGQASVPLGLLLIGATIARLEIKQIPPKFWQCVLALTGWRLCIMPIWGVLWCNRLQDIGWMSNDSVLAFVLMLQWSLPSATVQVYLTASYTDPEAEDHIQMDCLAIYVISQYSILFITLPFVATYAIKVNLGF